MRTYLSSMTRIADLSVKRYKVEAVARSKWARGDYVVGEVTGLHGLNRIELENGRLMELAEGDEMIGAFGTRYATLEATGSWKKIGPDRMFHLLTRGGLLGLNKSRSAFIPQLMSLKYKGHVVRRRKKVTMESVVAPVKERVYKIPTILVVGTSMSAGKTTASRIIIRILKEAGHRVVGAKLTGAGRYKDVLSMYDAGADYIYDFVDVGLPSTVIPEDEFMPAARQLLGRMALLDVDVAVVEVGASPLEPYNGTAAIQALNSQVRFTVLAATDPYAVVGVSKAYGRNADIVTGIAANTEAGVDLVEKLSGIRALNLRDKSTQPEFRKLLMDALATPKLKRAV